MAEIVARIVLTGGPCGGKTNSLTRIEQDLTEKGYHVVVISESATELDLAGITPKHDSPAKIDIFDFQEIILDYQLSKERIFENACSKMPENLKCVIIYDRGVIDNKAYITPKQFTELLDKCHLKELLLKDHYDMVIHLVTVADGQEQFYTVQNNVARREGIEDARRQDKKTMKAWSGHDHIEIIDNADTLEHKIDKVMDSIHELMGDPVPIRKQRRYEIDSKKLDLSFLTEDERKPIILDQTYLGNEDTGYEMRLRKRTMEESSTYYLTSQMKKGNGVTQILDNKKIDDNDYYNWLASSTIQGQSKKSRYSFIRNKQYFRLDVFDDSGLCILQATPTRDNKKIQIPDELAVIRDVTDNPDYQTVNIAKSSYKKKLEKNLS